MLITMSTAAAVTKLTQIGIADQLNFGAALRDGGSGVGVMARSRIADMTLSARSGGAGTFGRFFNRAASALSWPYRTRADSDSLRSRSAVLRSAGVSSPSIAAVNSSRTFIAIFRRRLI